MRWQGRKGSQNVEDRRSGRAKKVGTGLGLGSIVIIIIALLMGENPAQMLQQFGGGGQAQTQQTQTTTGGDSDELGQFVSVVLAETEEVWNKLFREQLGRKYQEPTLVLFDGKTTSACGYASAATGPFYCPGDRKLYIDLSFYRQLKERFKAPGDFAMAYVVAHEVAHHVQYLLGITRQVDSQRGRVSKTAYNDLSVRLELQADFLAGVWAHHAHRMNNILEEGDIEEALNAAHAIGDDRIQMETRGYVVPDSFTHGTSEQRMRWFTKGVKSGNLNEGDTFAATNL
ncbi:neutral zinc metallopeptidase [Saprospiraceae bacterium]|jgi:predicted metalloprotease|nr:neutral zinc metallopeptidase [Bacteroidota bacterium]MDB4727679.1 neutral zinc metallopeptidase [Saprospiraceae bacterium]MDF1863471.1 zinc metallopeptidase [Saprospiraceae bacterium]